MTRLAVLAYTLLFSLSAMQAAGANERAAAIEYSTCVVACQQGQNEAWCASYCQCTTERSQTEFTRQESRQFAKAMLYGGQIDPAVADKFRTIMLDCAAQTQH